MTNKTSKRKYTKKDKSANVVATENIHVGSSLNSFLEENNIKVINRESCGENLNGLNIKDSVIVDDNALQAANILAGFLAIAIRSVLDDEEKSILARLDIIKNMVNNGFKVG